MEPVEIGLGRSGAAHAVFRLTPTDEDAQCNPHLARKLEIDHGRRLPERVSGDDAPIERTEPCLAGGGAAVRGLEGWTVRPYLTLGLFDFGFVLLWRDLDLANWPEGAALAHRLLLRQLIGAEPPHPVVTLVEPLDEHIDLDPTLVDRADGSQFRALVRAKAGETMLRSRAAKPKLGQPLPQGHGLVPSCRGTLAARHALQIRRTACDRARATVATISRRLGHEFALTAADLSLALQMFPPRSHADVLSTPEDASMLSEAARVLQTAGHLGIQSADVRQARRLASRLLPPSDGWRKIAGAFGARRGPRLLGLAFEGSRTKTKTPRRLRGWIRRTTGELSRAAKPEIAA